MLFNTINIDRLRVCLVARVKRVCNAAAFASPFRPLRAIRKPAMTERLFSIGDREQVSCAERTEKNFSLFTFHLPLFTQGKRYAFTLAEVLITLGIIGVVAAMTIVPLIHKYKNKALETQFKKSMTTVQKGIMAMKEISGIDKLADFCTTNYDDGKGYIHLAECQGYFNEVFPQNQITRHDTIKSFNKKGEIQRSTWGSALASYGYIIFHPKRLNDGSYINMQINEWIMQVAVDTNGAKSPNRLGYDIFFFKIGENDMPTLNKPSNYTDEQIVAMWGSINNSDSYITSRSGSPCNLHSTQNSNGIGCFYYALRNECPFDSSKKYFECLP